jgi:conjugal transfer pilus assembly protein TraL
MSDNGYDKNRILRYLDSPSRVGFWTIDEAVALILPSTLGLLFEFPLTGIFLSVATYMFARFIKRNIGGRLFRDAAYWFLPGVHRRNKIKIPSNIRKFIG